MAGERDSHRPEILVPTKNTNKANVASLAAADDKVSRLLRHNLAVFPHVERRAVHARSLPSILCRTTQGTPDSSGKAQWSTCLCRRT